MSDVEQSIARIEQRLELIENRLGMRGGIL